MLQPMLNGKQYVVVARGGFNNPPAELIALNVQ